MTRTSPPQVAFSSGVLDPLLHRRFDYQRFQTGLAECRGFLPLPQGGFTRAPGTLYRGAVKDNAACQQIPFIFSRDDACRLEFTANVMRVWRYGELVMDGPSPYELATPFGSASIGKLWFVQQNDAVYIVDGLQPMQRLARMALDDWSIADAVIETGPFRVQNLDDTLTVQASAMTGTITLTASASLFQAGHIGGLMQLVPTDQTAIPLWTSNETIAVGNKRRYDKNIYQLTAGTNAGTNPPIHTEGIAATANGTKWQFVSDSIGVVRITAVASGTSATATVLKTVPQACVDDPTYRFSEGAWSPLYGYPAYVEALPDQRLVAAATPSDPGTAWFSTIGAYLDHTPSVEADGAFAYAIKAQIVGLKAGKTGLHIFAVGEELSARSDSRTQSVGPTTISFGIDSGTGSNGARPIAPDGDPMFITRDGGQVVRISYQLQEDGNRPTTLSLPAQHLGAEGFMELAWTGSPQRRAWIQRGNGDLAAMIYDPAEEVLGWAVVPVAGGFVTSMCVTPDAGGGVDVLSLTVEREVLGETVHMVEDAAPIFGLLTGASGIADAVHFFAAVQFAPGAPTDTFSVPHLAGREVYAWTDAGAHGPLTADEFGEVVLPNAVTRACIGLFDETHFAETLDIQAAAADGNTMGRKKRVETGIAVGIHRTAQGFIQMVEREIPQPDRVGPLTALIQGNVASDLTTAYTGVLMVEADTGQARELSARFRPFNGAPMTITAVVPPVKEAGR